MVKRLINFSVIIDIKVYFISTNNSKVIFYFYKSHFKIDNVFLFILQNFVRLLFRTSFLDLYLAFVVCPVDPQDRQETGDMRQLIECYQGIAVTSRCQQILVGQGYFDKKPN